MIRLPARCSHLCRYAAFLNSHKRILYHRRNSKADTPIIAPAIVTLQIVSGSNPKPPCFAPEARCFKDAQADRDVIFFVTVCVRFNHPCGVVAYLSPVPKLFEIDKLQLGLVDIFSAAFSGI